MTEQEIFELFESKVSKLKLNKKSLTYSEAYEVSRRYGDLLKETLTEALESGYPVTSELGEKLMRPLIDALYSKCVSVGMSAQEVMNNSLGIGLNAIGGSSKGLGNKIIDIVADSTAETLVRDVSPTIDTFGRTVISDTQRKNATFLGKSGFKVGAVRKAGLCDTNHTTISYKGVAYNYGNKYAKVCDYCSRWEGSWEYPNIPTEVWGFHDGCTCTLEYYAMDGTTKVIR